MKKLLALMLVATTAISIPMSAYAASAAVNAGASAKAAGSIMSANAAASSSSSMMLSSKSTFKQIMASMASGTDENIDLALSAKRRPFIS